MLAIKNLQTDGDLLQQLQETHTVLEQLTILVCYLSVPGTAMNIVESEEGGGRGRKEEGKNRTKEGESSTQTETGDPADLSKHKYNNKIISQSDRC